MELRRRWKRRDVRIDRLCKRYRKNNGFSCQSRALHCCLLFEIYSNFYPLLFFWEIKARIVTRSNRRFIISPRMKMIFRINSLKIHLRSRQVRTIIFDLSLKRHHPTQISITSHFTDKSRFETNTLVQYLNISPSFNISKIEHNAYKFLLCGELR